MEQTVRSKSTSRRPSRFRGWRLFAVALSLAFIILLCIRSFFFEVFYIPSESMHPTLEDGDRIVVERSMDEIQRGDIVVFDGTGSFNPYESSSIWVTHPLKSLGQWLGVVGSDTVYVKRVIGVGGDTVTCCDSSGDILVNGDKIAEDYLPENMPASEQKFEVEIPENRIWVMGDNRSNSQDSRALLGKPGGGLIRTDKVIGTVRWIIWPVDRWYGFE